MSSSPHPDRCARTELVSVYVLGAFPSSEMIAFEEHLSRCEDCRHELNSLEPLVGALASWPTDLLRPSPSLWSRLSSRIALETGGEAVSTGSPTRFAPEWEDVAPGISCKLLATDPEGTRVSMLVRLAPGAHYPPHVHAGIEELHLLDGELWIEDKKLRPGDYRRAEAGTADHRVWSETGCTCVLITSPRDLLLPLE